MADLPNKPITVITEQNAAICLAELRTDVRYIRKSIDGINRRWEKQDETNHALLQNCNREERWENVGDKVEDLDTRVTKMERAKCPKLPILEDHETRIDALESTHHQDVGAKAATRTNLEYILAGITAFEFFIILWQFMGTK